MSSDIFGCHDMYLWHLVGQGQECCSASGSEQHSLPPSTHTQLVQNVNTAMVEKS